LSVWKLGRKRLRKRRRKGERGGEVIKGTFYFWFAVEMENAGPGGGPSGGGRNAR
jgi:hypothetical protein